MKVIFTQHSRQHCFNSAAKKEANLTLNVFTPDHNRTIIQISKLIFLLTPALYLLPEFQSALRSSYHWMCSVRKRILKSFLKLTGKHLCQSFCINKVADRHVTLIRKRPWNRYFLVNLAKFLRTLFLQNTSGRLILCV